MTENNGNNFQKIGGFVLGIAMFAFSVYGWKVLEIEGILMIFLGLAGLGVATKSVGIDLDI